MNSDNSLNGQVPRTDHAEGDVTVLNTLIGTLLDSIEGYQKSAQDVDNTRFATLFNERAQERQRAATKLQSAVAQLGGKPEDDATMLGSIHRAFVDLKSAVLGRDDKAIVNEIERGEDYLKAKFETALKNADLSAIARSAVDEAWVSVKTGHDQMRDLKHSLQH